MRVIAGEFGGRTLKTPTGRRTRPTQGKVRQVLFDMIGAGVRGTRILDLFAGSGALGIEALSRGAAGACFVERNEASLRCLRANLEALDLVVRTRVLAVSVEASLRILAQENSPYDWVLADPPYESEPEEWILRAERDGAGGILAEGGTLVIERPRRQACPERIGRLRRRRIRNVGETSLEFFGWEERNDEEKGDFRRDV